MFHTIALMTVTMIFGFTVGFAVKRGGLCTYVAALDIVREQRPERLFAFLGAAAWATVGLVPLSWWFPDQVAMSWSHGSLIIALLGGIVIGLGAYLNKGCFFGTFVQLVGGNLTYVGTLLGLSLGVIVTDLLLVGFKPQLNLAPLVAEPGLIAGLWLGGMGIFAMVLLFSGLGTGSPALRDWGSISVMLTIGLGGGLLYATVSGWDYGSVLTQLTRYMVEAQTAGPSLLAILATLGSIAGGITAAIKDRSFRLQAPQWRGSIGCLSGGMLMGSAAIIIPGGNDGMLLIGIPSMAPHSIVSYAFMVASLIGLFFVFDIRGGKA